MFRRVTCVWVCLATLLMATGCAAVEPVISLFKFGQDSKDRSDQKKIEAEDREVEQAARVEAGRDRGFPSSEIDRAVKRIAAKIATDLPRDPFVFDFVTKHKASLIITRDTAENQTRHTADETVENLLENVMIELGRDSTFRKFFDITINREKALKIIEDSEGAPQDIIVSDDGDAPFRYPPDMIVVVRLTLFERDEKGRTTWNINFQVPQPKTRRLLVNETITVPLASPGGN